MDNEPAALTPPPEEPLPPVPRSFPVPKRRDHEEEEWESEGLLAGWGMKLLLLAACVMAGLAAWVKFSPDPAPAAAPVAATAPALPPGPPDAARDLYIGNAPPSAPPVVAVMDAPAVPAPAAPEVAAVEPAPVTPPEPPAPPMVAVATESFTPDPRFPEVKPPSDTPPVTTSPAVETPPAPALATADTPPPPPVPVPVKLGELEEKYLAALGRGSAAAPETEKPAWRTEIQRVRDGQPLPESSDGLPAELARLQNIYRAQQARATAVIAEPAGEAQTVNLFFCANGPLILYVNGNPRDAETVWGAKNGEHVGRITLPLRPGDVIAVSPAAGRRFGLVGRSGVRTCFASGESWDMDTTADMEFMKGAAHRNQQRIVARKSTARTGLPAEFEKAAGVHSTDYSIIEAARFGTPIYRYILRKVDLPALR